jgi:shikimate kinase
MPGVGKSTIGVILAKVMSRNFIDTDIYIQAGEGKTLQEIIDKNGLESFCSIEERYIVSLSYKRNVIATGGSVVYSNKAMNYLKMSGILIHLYLPFDLLKKRLKDFAERGVVMKRGQRLDQLFNERLPLYRRYADKTIDCSGKNHEEVISEILCELQNAKCKMQNAK